MKNLLLSTAAAMLAFSAPASAQEGKAMEKGEKITTSLNNASYAFTTADLNSDGFLAPAEYNLYRIHTVDRAGLMSYRGGTGPDRAPVIKQSFGALDIDNDQWVSRKEFIANADLKTGTTGDSAATTVAFVPDYMTVTYYLTATPVEADYFEGRDVVNLKGDTVGEIQNIIQARGEHAGLYALVDIDGPAFYRYPGVERAVVGISLDDLLITGPGESLLLSTKGEETLSDPEAPIVQDFKYEEVDTLFRMSV